MKRLTTDMDPQQFCSVLLDLAQTVRVCVCVLLKFWSQTHTAKISYNESH